MRTLLINWEQRELSDIAEVRTGKAFSSSDFTDDGEFRVVTNKNIQDKTTGKIFTGDRINVSDQTVIDKYVLSGENILVTMDGANIGKVGMYTDSGALLAQRVGRLNSAVLNFVYQIVSDEKFISRMNQLAVGNAIKHISLEQIGRYEIAVPESETEKTKIGQLLSNLDNLIAANQRKLDLLKEQKKGYLQKMFPKNGAKVPELRFAGFADDWEQRKLSDISDVTKLAGFEFTKYVRYQETGKIIALRGLNVKNGKLVLDDVKYIDDSDFSKLNRSKLYKNDILLTYVGTVGELAIVPEDDKYYLAPNVARIRLQDHVNSIFICQMMNDSNFYNRIILPLIATSSQPALSMENVRKFQLLMPDYQEQQKIGSFFKQIDDTIALHQRKLDLLKEQKKGFLQKMFV